MVKADFGLGLSVGRGAASENGLVATWLYDWAWGQLKTKSLQRYAASAIRSGFRNDLLVRVASLGTGGVYTGNMTKQLMQWVAKVYATLNGQHRLNQQTYNMYTLWFTSSEPQSIHIMFVV